MSTSIEYASFLIRVWRETGPRCDALEECVAPQDWQGEVEHIQTGERWSFSTLDELLGFLRRQTENPEVSERS